MKAHENPFCASAIAKIRYALPAEALQELALQVSTGGRFHAIAGPEGTGKTTLIEDLQPFLQALGYDIVWVCLSLESSKSDKLQALKVLGTLTQNKIALFDGGEVLSAWQWYRLRHMRKQIDGKIVASLHQPHRLPVLHKTQPNWPLAKQFVRQLAWHFQVLNQGL